MQDLTERYDALENVQNKANTARRVVELMSSKLFKLLTRTLIAIENYFLDLMG